jgi:SAM-dependent methyltransferase
MGYAVEEIDPLLNCDLNTFFRRRSTAKGSYDIVFSTSVLEHVPDDELFMKQIAGLLSPGGVAVLTCDYDDQYKPGDPIPSVDCRLYTQRDLKERILPLLEGCSLVDEPQWDCPNPDFTYAGFFRYTFATLVFQKRKV